MLGASAAGLSRPTRLALLAGIAGLTAASEKVSFTKVIERTPALRWLDMLGRRPVPQVPAATIRAHRGTTPLARAGTGTRSADDGLTPPAG
jgi:hypothetical protein